MFFLVNALSPEAFAVPNMGIAASGGNAPSAGADPEMNALEKQAREYSDKRQWAKAQAVYGSILEKRRREWGPDDFRLVGPINNVVRVTCVDGKCADTVPYLQDLLRIRLKKFGLRNADVATTYALIAEANEKMRRYDEAMKNFGEAVQIRDELYGKTAEMSLRTRMNLIRVAIKKNDKAAARKNLQQCQTLLSATRKPRPEMEKLLSHFAEKI
jgi:tetratricopeptide (TPR) repeat protein